MMPFLRPFNRLSDRIGNLIRLSQTEADVTVAVTDHDDRAEAEPSSAFYYLCYAVYVNNPVLQLKLRRVNPLFCRSTPNLL